MEPDPDDPRYKDPIFGSVAQIRAEGWLQIENPDLTVDDAIAELVALGNQILEVDRENRRIKVMDTILEVEQP